MADNNKVWIFFIKNDKGKEGVPTFQNAKTNEVFTAIAMDKERLSKLLPLMKALCGELKRPFRLAEYSFTQDLDPRSIYGETNERETCD